MITAIFPSETTTSTTVTDMVWQYDYGQILQVEGITVDDITELDFATSKTADRVQILAVEKISETVMQTQIPDEILENSGLRKNYNIFVWVFVHHDGEGETTHQITIPVLTRPARQKEDDGG